jgi:hypothetical protein
MRHNKIWLISLSVAALLVLLAYLNATIFGIPIPDRLVLMLIFLLGPVAIAGVMEIRKKLSLQYSGSLLDVASVFLIIGFSLLNLMIVVQQTIFAFHRKAMQAATDDAAKETLRLVFSEVNYVQLGIDISLDIFYCIGLILLSIVLMQLSLSRKILGLYGLITGLGLLVLNMWTFPAPPGESGLIDLGPATALFWVAFIVMIFFEGRQKSTSPVLDT